MIICPVCNANFKESIEICCWDKNTFYPNGSSYYHFTGKLRGQSGKISIYSYQATIPPFQIVWKTNCAVTVYRLDAVGGRLEQVHQSAQPVNYDGFLQACQRFKILVPFS